MLKAKIIQSGLEDLKRITKADFHFCDEAGETIASTFDKKMIDKQLIADFAVSSADSQNVKGYNYLKLVKDDEETFVLVVYAGGADGYMFGKIAASEIYHLMAIDSGKVDRDDFYRELLLDGVMPGEIAKRAEKLKIQMTLKRVVFIINVDEEYTDSVKEMLRNMFSENREDYVLVMEDDKIALIKSVEEDDMDAIEEQANQIVGMINMELMIRARVTYGHVANELKALYESYKESAMALEVVHIFYEDRDVASYMSLGIGRLIHQLPKGLCEMFLTEVFGKMENAKLDDDDFVIIEKFFQNNLNVSETARILELHRTTFIYRLDKLKKKTGLDIRKFEDAMTLKIAMMVARYISFEH